MGRLPLLDQSALACKLLLLWFVWVAGFWALLAARLAGWPAVRWNRQPEAREQVRRFLICLAT
jgi:hypothetical protein